MREKYHRIPPRQTKRVRRLRRDATFPESLLWSCLRGGRAAGMKFRRQAAIGEFIVDFYCASVGLVIELDGLSHETQRTYDEQRTIALEERGLRVVRYTNDQVLESLHEVVEDIVRLATACKGTSNPPPTPP